MRVAVLAASRRELLPAQTACRSAGPLFRCRLGQFPYCMGRLGDLELYFLQTGTGPRAARQATEAAVSEWSPDAIISTGYAGSLGAAGIGDVIIGTRVLDCSVDTARSEIQTEIGFRERGTIAARDAVITWSQGPVVTVKSVLWQASEKEALAIGTGAIAVDMESAPIAQVAVSAGVPFLVVRAISDRVAEDLPMDFNLWFAPFGAARCFWELLKRPTIMPGLWQMKRHADHASESLRKFFCALVIVLGAHVPPTETKISMMAIGAQR